MAAQVILNPYSGRWQGRARRAEVEATLHAAGVTFDLAESNGPGHAEDLAEAAARVGAYPIIVAGGDGTIGEVLNGLHRVNREGVLGPMGVMPLGTANDLVHNLGLPLDLAQAAQAIAAGKTRVIDVGRVNDWIFCNNSAVGLEPVVTIYNIRMVWLRGVIRYLVAAFRAIASKPNWQMQIAWDGGSYQGPVSLVSVGNCPVTGGLFRMAPAADPADGLLTFVYGYAPTRRRMFSLLPRAISGEYVKDPAIHQHHTKRLKILADPATPLQADGEIRSMSAQDLTYEILPARLTILSP